MDCFAGRRHKCFYGDSDDDELRQIVAQEVSVQQELAKIKRELNDI